MALDIARNVAITRGFTGAFVQAFDAATPFYPKVCMVVPSTGADESYGMLGSVPQMQEWVANRQSKELRGASYTLVNADYESTINVKKNDLDDDRLGLYPAKFSEAGTRARMHPDALWAKVLVAGESQPCWDGQYFYDTDHSWGDSGTQSNDLTSIAATPTDPTIAEFKAAFSKAVGAMMSFKDDYGEYLAPVVVNKLSGLSVVVPWNMRDVAYNAFTGGILINSSTNVVIEQPEIVVLPSLGTTSKFHVLKTDQSIKPFIFQKRKDVSWGWKGLDDREFKDAKWMADARYAMGYGAWWNACLVTLQVS